MNCPRCGYKKAKYKNKKLDKKKPRKNFEAKCNRCGFEWNTKEGVSNG